MFAKSPRIASHRSRRTNSRRRRLFLEQLEARRVLTVAISNPAFSFVDVDNDGLFYAGTDVPLTGGEADDGVFDTRRAEGAYTTPVPGAGLYIGGPAISVAGEVDYRSDGLLKINTDLTAGDELTLTSRDDTVTLDDPTITAPNEIEIEAELDIVSVEDVIVATGPGSEVDLKAGRDILLEGTSVSADRSVELRAGGDIVVNDTKLDGSISASDPIRGEVDLRADGGDVDVSEASISAGDEIQIIADRDILAIESVFSALGNSSSEIELRAGNDIVINDVESHASREIDVRSSGGEIFADSALMEALGNSNGEVELRADGDVIIEAAMLYANRDVEIRSGGSISAVDAGFEALGNSRGEIELRAEGNINAWRSVSEANSKVRAFAGGWLTTDLATINALGGSNGEVELRAEGDISSTVSLIEASREVDIRSTHGSIDVSGSFIGGAARKVILIGYGDVNLFDMSLPTTVISAQEIVIRSLTGDVDASETFLSGARKVELRAAEDVYYCPSLIMTGNLKLIWGGSLFVACPIMP